MSRCKIEIFYDDRSGRWVLDTMPLDTANVTLDNTQLSSLLRVIADAFDDKTAQPVTLQ